MGYHNSAAYAQRFAAAMVRKLQALVRVYMGDFIVKDNTFDESPSNLESLFQVLDEHITLNSAKAVIGFPDVKMLGQHVNGLGLATLEDHVQAIKAIDEPSTLADIEHFPGVIGWPAPRQDS